MDSEKVIGSSVLDSLEQGGSDQISTSQLSSLLDDWETFCEQTLPIQPWNYKTTKEFAHIDSKYSSDPEIQNICKICNQVFKNARGVKQHMGKLHEKKDRLWPCECAKTFKNKYALKTHIKQVHDGSEKVECTICSKIVYNKYVLSKHMLNMHY